MEAAWNVGNQQMMPSAMGPTPLGASMPEQLARHMQQAQGPTISDPSFFTQGPVGLPPQGVDWASEFRAGLRPSGPGSGPGMMLQRPVGPEGDVWAAEFAARQKSPAEHAAIEAAFNQARAASSTGPMMAAPPVGPMFAPMGPGFGMGPGMQMPMFRPTMSPAFAAQHPIQQVPIQQTPAPEVTKSESALAELQTGDDMAQAAQMVEMLRNSGNPKFANSQFVSFIDKVSKGDLQFKENTVVDRHGQEVDWDSLYDTEAATASVQDRNDLQTMWQASGESQVNLSGADTATPEEMEKIWQDAAMAGGDATDMRELWEAAGDSFEAETAYNQFLNSNSFSGGLQDMIPGSMRRSEYELQENNPYRGNFDPLAEAIRLINEGRDKEALLALEAEVQKNPESSEGWRLLGQLYAELDQDVEAIQCLRKGHEVDPYNLDSLLALGVSCTNELDQLLALQYLRRWIENHEDHQALTHGLEMPPEFDFEAWRRQVTDLFKQAAVNNPTDADVFISLGVMENINRNYPAAVSALATACRLKPDDHTVWNKLGATLANSGESQGAITAYHQGLSLKPNYARSWSNLAIAHANLGEFTDAARFYLSSLVLNPQAKHIWNFLHSAAINMESHDEVIRLIDGRDLPAAAKAIPGVIDPQQLPPRQKELPRPADEILSQIGL